MMLKRIMGYAKTPCGRFALVTEKEGEKSTKANTHNCRLFQRLHNYLGCFNRENIVQGNSGMDGKTDCTAN